MSAEAVVTPPYVARPLRIAPFRALHLPPSRIGGAAAARAFAGPYRDIASRFADWERAGQVVRDEVPALHLHEYTAAGITVRGLVGNLDISHLAADITEAAVLPHEGIHPAQADDLADRMLQMQLNPAPILLVHRGSERLRALTKEVRAEPSPFQFTDRSGQYHRVWPITAPERIAAIAGELAELRTLLADGHHRYSAYLQMHAASRHDPALGTGLAMLVDQTETPLFLGAIHRVFTGITLDHLAALPGTRILPAAGPQEAVAALDADTLVATDGRDWRILRITRSGRLAVEVLQRDLVPAFRRAPTATLYAHSVDEALRTVARRRSVAVLMPTPAFDGVLRSASAGTLLPEKATSFQPKPSVGVLIRSLRDG